MSTKVERVEERFQVKRYKIQHPVSAYTFPHEACIHQVRFDDRHMHVELTDGRILSVPLWWIPTLYHALPEERNKYELSRDRMMIRWDPDKCAINDEVRIADYLRPDDSTIHLAEERILERGQPQFHARQRIKSRSRRVAKES